MRLYIRPVCGHCPSLMQMRGVQVSFVSRPRRGSGASLLGQRGIVGPLANLARDAQIEAVGVYQGKAGGVTQTNDGRKMGYVKVRLRRSVKPVVLVLSSYEPVRWIRIPESGVRLAAVRVSGY